MRPYVANHYELPTSTACIQPISNQQRFFSNQLVDLSNDEVTLAQDQTFMCLATTTEPNLLLFLIANAFLHNV